MPTAQPFKALGVGNGFPFCMKHESESEISARETVNGYQRKLRLDGSVGEIMKIFWSLYSLRIQASLRYPTDPPTIKSIDETVRFDDTSEIEDFYEAVYGVPLVGNADFINKPKDRLYINDVLADAYSFQATGNRDNTFYSFAPNFYYNTTSKNYVMLFDFQVEMDIFYGGGLVLDVYTSNQLSDSEGTNHSKTVNIFGKNYQLYSENDNIIVDSMTITDQYFTYTQE